MDLIELTIAHLKWVYAMVSILSLAAGSRTYQASTSLVHHYVTIDALDHHVGIDRQLRLKGHHQQVPNSSDRTHVEHLKDPKEVLLPRSNRILIALRV